MCCRLRLAWGRMLMKRSIISIDDSPVGVGDDRRGTQSGTVTLRSAPGPSEGSLTNNIIRQYLFCASKSTDSMLNLGSPRPPELTVPDGFLGQHAQMKTNIGNGTTHDVCCRTFSAAMKLSIC
jgi:hypothetical protein